MASRPRGARAWCFTAHSGGGGAAASPLDSYERSLSALPADSFLYLVWQREVCPDTRREHLQGYIKYAQQFRRNQVTSHLNVGAPHLEVARGSPAQNKAYCTKDDSRAPGSSPHERGALPPPERSRSDLHAACEVLKAPGGLKRLAAEHPTTLVKYRRGLEALYDDLQMPDIPRFRSLNVYVYEGHPGAGKSHAAEAYDPGHSFTLPCSAGAVTWFDGYAYERTLLIQEFKGNIPFRQLLQILDGLPQRFEVKGSFKQAAWTTVILTSNSHPCVWYPHEPYLHGPLARRITDVYSAVGVWPASVWSPGPPPLHAPPPPPVAYPLPAPAPGSPPTAPTSPYPPSSPPGPPPPPPASPPRDTTEDAIERIAASCRALAEQTLSDEIADYAPPSAPVGIPLAWLDLEATEVQESNDL